MARTCSAVEHADGHYRVGVAPLLVIRLVVEDIHVSVHVPMSGWAVVGVVVAMNDDPFGLANRPQSERDKHQPNQPFCPCAPGMDIDPLPSDQAQAAQADHPESVSKTPEEAES